MTRIHLQLHLALWTVNVASLSNSLHEAGICDSLFLLEEHVDFHFLELAFLSQLRLDNFVKIHPPLEVLSLICASEGLDFSALVKVKLDCLLELCSGVVLDTASFQ